MSLAALCLNCCFEEAPRKTTRKIDRSMIGAPSNFQHTGHIGAADACASSMSGIEGQMKSKGGYEGIINSNNPVHVKTIDIAGARSTSGPSSTPNKDPPKNSRADHDRPNNIPDRSSTPVFH